MKGKGKGNTVNAFPNCIKPASKKKRKMKGSGAAKKGVYTRGPMA